MILLFLGLLWLAQSGPTRGQTFWHTIVRRQGEGEEASAAGEKIEGGFSLKRRWISILTALALVVAMIPCATLAAEPETAAGALSGASEETEVSAVEQEVALSADSDTDAGQTEAPQVTSEEEQPGDELQAADAQDTDAGQTEAPQVTSEQEQPGDELQAADAQDTDAGQTEVPRVTSEEEQPGDELQAADAQDTDAGQAGAPEQVQQEAQLMTDQGQDPYEVSYSGPNQTVEIPFAVFGNALNGWDMVSGQVLDGQGKTLAQLKGKKDNIRHLVVLTMPYDLDLTAGTYDLRFLLCQSWSGETSQLDGYATLTLDQAIQGIHLINTELRYDGADEGSYVLRFQNGTGDNRITDISRIRFMTRMEDGSTEGFGLEAGTGSFTCDLDTGEITIPASSLARQDLNPVVYFGMMDFTLANGETITANSLNIVPDEAVLPGDFVNDGGQSWYLIPQSGVELSGTVKTPDQAGDVQLKLTRTGESEAAYEVTLSGQAGTTDYSIPQVEAGAYILTVSKEHCAVRDYPITVGADPVEQDVELWLLGDVNGDGKVSTLDAALINSYVRSARELEDYPLACADVNGDGRVTTLDAAKINAFVRTGTAL